MYLFYGDKIVDNTGKEFFWVEDEKEVQFPVKLYNAKVVWSSPNFPGLYQTEGEYRFRFKARNLEEFNDKQDDRW